jgi:phosphoenolpyruvate carboxylase
VIGAYIVSMAEDVDDLLAVRWLAAVAGLGTDGDEGALDVCPLFETVGDLERAADVLERVLTDPVLGAHARGAGHRQLVMVGYSDSNKDGGVASARWALHLALERMAEVAARRAVALTVFHGRGGTVSRGGGAIHRAVAAMPAASIGGRLRLTEQGEVIDATYGLPQIALRNLERMLGAIVLRAAEEGDDAPRPEWRVMADTVSAVAREAYRALVYEDPRFEGYFRAGTPIDVIERMSMGSRPSRRRAAAGIEDLRAIPWVFSWTQCRAMLPGWYGLGAGLDAARREHGPALLRDAAAHWPFFHVLLGDVEMVLAKADLEIAALYRPLAPEESHGVFRDLRAEYERTVSLLLEIRGNDDLLDGDPTLQRSIRLRNPYVDPMNILQVDLLARWREQGRPTGPLLDALLSTINGIARGLQNTG